MSWRFAAAKLASPEKEHNSMIEFQSTAITCGLDSFRTQPAFSSTGKPREKLSTPCAELAIQGLTRWGGNLSRNV